MGGFLGDGGVGMRGRGRVRAGGNILHFLYVKYFGLHFYKKCSVNKV